MADQATDWIEWAGGECPVTPDTVVDAMLRDEANCDRRRAGDLYWDYKIPACDQIIAYRVVPA